MPPPHFVKEALGRVAASSDFAVNQYTRSQVRPEGVNNKWLCLVFLEDIMPFTFISIFFFSRIHT